jgi:hypothetical protein
MLPFSTVKIEEGGGDARQLRRRGGEGQ